MPFWLMLAVIFLPCEVVPLHEPFSVSGPDGGGGAGGGSAGP